VGFGRGDRTGVEPWGKGVSSLSSVGASVRRDGLRVGEGEGQMKPGERRGGETSMKTGLFRDVKGKIISVGSCQGKGQRGVPHNGVLRYLHSHHEQPRSENNNNGDINKNVEGEGGQIEFVRGRYKMPSKSHRFQRI